jgi:hypothetical protein
VYRSIQNINQPEVTMAALPHHGQVSVNMRAWHRKKNGGMAETGIRLSSAEIMLSLLGLQLRSSQRCFWCRYSGSALSPSHYGNKAKAHVN